MKTNRIAVPLLAAALLAGGCDTLNKDTQNETIGTVTGAVLGAFLGSKVGGGDGRIWAMGAGAVLGAIGGSTIGKRLDEADRTMMTRTSQASLEHTRSGSVSTWSNPDSGHSGSVTPTRTFQKTDGTYCRDFTQTVDIDGQRQNATGTACRQPDGTWRIVE
ncbi:MAG: glycine zipper 2TM domain-containing protein [Alphaproteobacteria bacterium]|nr:glycine zipper 2TM domain-containing protein [Alphaproteobacteria bacterium]